MAYFRRFGIINKDKEEIQILINFDAIKCIAPRDDETVIFFIDGTEVVSSLEYEHLATAMDNGGSGGYST